MNRRLAAASMAAALLVAAVAAAVAACGDGTEEDGGRDRSAPIPAGPGTSVEAGVAGEDTAKRITVAAAADLRDAFAVLEPRIETACATDVVMVYGSSGQLKTQVLAGAEFGVFLSADSGFAAEVAEAGLAVPNGIASYGVGRLALAWREGLTPLTGLADLRRPDVSHIAIANPVHAPYGRAGREALERARLYDDVSARLVLGENIRQATDYVQKGNADAGLVALALVIRSSTPYLTVDQSLYTPIVQAGVVVKGTGAERTGRCVLQFLLDPEGQEVLHQFGFESAAP